MPAVSPIINPLFLCLSEEQLEEDELHSNGGKVSPVLAAHLQNVVAMFLIQSLFSLPLGSWLLAMTQASVSSSPPSSHVHPFMFGLSHISIFAPRR